MINIKDIINDIEYIEYERVHYKEKYQSNLIELHYIKKAIERMGLNDHINAMITEIKEEEEIPF